MQTNPAAGGAPNAPAAYYDPTSVALHWLTAALVVALWALGETIDWFAKGAPRIDARSVHITLGATLALVLLVRIVWRVRWARPPPPAYGGLSGAAARAGHLVLYALLIAVVALGIANAWIRGDDLFGIYTIPSIAPGDKALRKFVGHWHGNAANLILIVAGLHALVGLVHHYFLKDGVLRRMLPPKTR